MPNDLYNGVEPNALQDATESEYFDLDSWLIGFAMGLANEPLPLSVAEEVSA